MLTSSLLHSIIVDGINGILKETALEKKLQNNIVWIWSCLLQLLQEEINSSK